MAGEKNAFASSVRVSCGANTECVQAEGMTVAELRENMQETMNIPADAEVRLSGQNVEETYTIQNGDRFEFVRPSGQKG